MVDPLILKAPWGLGGMRLAHLSTKNWGLEWPSERAERFGFMPHIYLMYAGFGNVKDLEAPKMRVIHLTPCAYILEGIDEYIRTCIAAYLHTCMYPSIQPSIHPSIDTHTYTYITLHCTTPHHYTTPHHTTTLHYTTCTYAYTYTHTFSYI